MSRTLTSRQAEELHKSIIAYLAANNLQDSASAMRTELGLGEDAFDTATAKGTRPCWRRNGPVSCAYKKRSWI
ncbi:hypothetical protein NXS19_008598 [Fusarium pseudograminearum]|nr:hypothetical protein NXS19_008598 [Fusarium pseudograminearum]